MGEFSALKKAIDDSMATIKHAKNAIKNAINTVGEPLGVRVDDTDTFRSYGEHLTGKPDGQSDYIRLLYQRIWSSDDNTDAPKKCIITNDDFPAAPMHNYGYIDINDKSAKEFGDEDKYVAVSSFIVNIQNPPVPILVQENYFWESADMVTTIPPTVDANSLPDVLDANTYPALISVLQYFSARNNYTASFHNVFVGENGAITVDAFKNFGENKIYVGMVPDYWRNGATFKLKTQDKTFTFIKRVALSSSPTSFTTALYEKL